MTKNPNEPNMELSLSYRTVVVPAIVKVLKAYKPEKPIKAPKLILQVNEYLRQHKSKIRLSDVALRACCNYIRSNSIAPVIATNKGYFISYNRKIIQEQICSLQKRAISITACALGLKELMKK